MTAVITSPSETFDTEFNRYLPGTPTTEKIPISPFAHLNIQPLTPIGGAYPDTLGIAEGETGMPAIVLEYAEVKTEMNNLATTYTEVEYDDIGDSHLLNEMGCLRINDDGVRPIFFIDCGVHGNEAVTTSAVLDIVELYLTSDDPVMKYARDHLAFYVLGTHNPDGMIQSAIDPDGPPGANPADPDFPYQSGRNNRNPVTWSNGARGVNLNRQWPNYFDIRQDVDKGNSALSEAETSKIQTWLLTSDRVKRILFYAQLHGWESRTTWGYLTEWQIHTRRSLNTLRGTFLHAQHLISKLNLSAYTLIGATPALTKYNSKMKPYLAEWIWNRTEQPAACCLFEYPEQENSFGLVNTVTLALLQGFLVGTCEAIPPYSKSYLITPAYNAPVNFENPFLLNRTTDVTGVFRPSFTRFNGIKLEQFLLGVDGFDTPVWRITRPTESAWPIQKSAFGDVNVFKTTLAYTAKTPVGAFPTGNEVLDGPSGKALIVADTNTGAQAFGTLTLIPIEGTISDGETITAPVGHSATADSDSLNHAENMYVGQAGENDSGTLAAGHKLRFDNDAINATDGLDFESKYGDMCHDGTYLYFAGGWSDDGTYRDEIQRATITGQFDVPTTGTWSTWANMPEFLRYDGGTGAFTVGQVITGTTSTETATIEAIFGDTTSGVMLISSATGAFTNNEQITDPGTGDALVDGTNESGLQRHTLDFWHDPVSDDDFLIFAGGRIPETVAATTSNYMDAIWKMRISDQQITGIVEGFRVGYHTSCIYEDVLYLFGGYNGSSVTDLVTSVDLATDTLGTETPLPDSLRRHAGALNVETGIYYIGGGQTGTAGNTTQDKIYAYDLNPVTKTVSEIVYELETPEDDDEHPDSVSLFPTTPLVLDAGAFINYEEEERCFTIVGGETSTGVFVDTITELDPVTEKLTQSATNNARWGYLRWSSFDTGVPTDRYVTLLVARDSYPQSDIRVPYLRHANITDPLGDWQQIHRSPYLVPTRDGFFTTQRALEFQPAASPVVTQDENQIRTYIPRIYGDGTWVDVPCHQLLKVNGIGFAPTVVTGGTLRYDNLQPNQSFRIKDQIDGVSSGHSARIRDVTILTSTTGILSLFNATGVFQDNEDLEVATIKIAEADGTVDYKQADAITETFDKELNTEGSVKQTIDFAFQPCFGSQMNVDRKIVDFTCDTTKDVKKIEIHYESSENFTTSDPVTPSLFSQLPEGKFKLIYTDSVDTDAQIDFFVNAELNHLRVYQGIWLQDVVHCRLTVDPLINEVTIHLWFYNLQFSKTFQSSARITGYTATGVGAAFSESSAPAGQTIQTLNFERYYQAITRLKIEDVDVTDQLMDGGLATVETTLDTPDLTVFNASKAVVTLENESDQWNTRNATNFFNQQSYDVSGYEAKVEIEFGYKFDETELYILLFSGKVSNISQGVQRRTATITAVDGSLKFRKEKLHNFGVSITNEALSNDNYTGAAPQFDFDTTRLPISKESVTATINSESVNIVPSIRREGLLSPLNVEIGYENGQFLVEAEPTTFVLDYDGGLGAFTVGQTATGQSSGAQGRIIAVIGTVASGSLHLENLTPATAFSNNEQVTDPITGDALANGVNKPPEESVVLATAKYAYQHRRPDALVREIGTKLELSANEIDANRVKLTHWDTTDGNQWYSSHGRPYWDQDQVSVFRDLRYDSTKDEMWILTDTKLLKYKFSDDTYTKIADVPLTNYAMLKMAPNDSFGVFFVVLTSHKEGNSLDVTQHNRIYKYTVSTQNWFEAADDDEYPQFTYTYDQGITSLNYLIAENRFSFLYYKGYVYFKFAEATAVPGDDSAGVKRIDVSTDVVETPFSQFWTGGSAKSGIEFSLDFTIDTENDKLIVVMGYGANQFEIREMDLNGSNDTQRHLSTEVGQAVIAISDLVFEPANNLIYMVVGKGTATDSLVGTAELRSYETDTYGVSTLKTYSQARSARSGYLAYDDNVYYFEGTHWASSPAGSGPTVTFPSKTEAGHLIRISNKVITDLGFNWESEINADNQGAHTGCMTNIVDDGKNLHFGSGYGVIGAADTATRTSPLAPDTSPTNKRTNNIWIQFGFDLASKIEIFKSNDLIAWDALSDLAKVSQYHVSFSPEGKLSFQPRSFIKSTLVNALSMTGEIPEIELVDASRFPDATELKGLYGYVMVQPGQVDSELFRYTDKVSNTLIGIERAQDLTAATSHSIGDACIFVDHRAYNHTRLDNILDIQPLKPDYKQIYNHVRVPYGDGSEVIIDKDVVNDTTSPASETRFGDRFFDVNNNLLANHDRGWAEILGREYYQLYSPFAHEFLITLRYTPNAEIGQTVVIDSAQRVLLNYQPCLILRVTHNWTDKSTVLLCRTYTELNLS